MAHKADKQLEQYLERKLKVLRPVFARMAIGDFSKDVKIPKKEDQFTEFYVGVQIMLEVVRERTKELEDLNHNLEELVTEKTKALSEAQALAHIGNWEWDIPGNVVTWSEELHRIFGRPPSRQPLSYESYLKCLHPDDRDRVDTVVRRSFKTGRPYTVRHRVVHKNGSVRHIWGKGRVIVAKGQPVKMVGVAQDVTEQTHAGEVLAERADELERINRLLVGRELKMVELKNEIRQLKRRLP